jgi:hypothetical protein
MKNTEFSNPSHYFDHTGNRQAKPTATAPHLYPNCDDQVRYATVVRIEIDFEQRIGVTASTASRRRLSSIGLRKKSRWGTEGRNFFGSENPNVDLRL